MKLQKNSIFAGRYRLTRHLGTGGYAVVWKAEDLMANNGIIAIKVFVEKPAIGRDETLAHLNEVVLTSKKPVVINGVGGIGKTTVARVFVH